MGGGAGGFIPRSQFFLKSLKYSPDNEINHGEILRIDVSQMELGFYN